MIEEVNLKRNLINLRVIEMVAQTCQKIKEIKLSEEEPRQRDLMKEFKDDKEHSRKTMID